MKLICLFCQSNELASGLGSGIVRFGSFYRRSYSRWVARFRCQRCFKTFSQATSHPCFRQKKRHLNFAISRLLVSGVSLRRISLILNIDQKTAARKLIFLAKLSKANFVSAQAKLAPVFKMEFDDLETFEHTKCKPLSITLAVEKSSRRILGFRVSAMPAKGRLAPIALKRYGPREDRREQAREELFLELQPKIHPQVLIRSDKNPHYLKVVRHFFPTCDYQTIKGRRGCVVGQGELKAGKYDPLFSLNHTCAMLRANINRLFRRTWCTTKRPDRLAAHIVIYIDFHNQILIKEQPIDQLPAAI